MRAFWPAVSLITLVSCAAATSFEPTVMQGQWGISGAGPGCGFYALAEIEGNADAFVGSAVLETQPFTEATVAVTGGRDAVVLGSLVLYVAEGDISGEVLRLSGDFSCDGSPGAWSMYRYAR